MKQILICLSLVAGIMMLGACKEKKQTDDIITSKYVPKALVAPIKMENDLQVRSVTWQGAAYQVEVFRRADESLPMLKDDDGQEYVDNIIDVTIKRQDGSIFFQRSFTKATFVPYLEDIFRKNGQLSSIRFDEVDQSAVEFSVVIGMPDAADDLFVPLELVVDRQGNIRIEKDDDMDMLDYDVDDDDDD